VLDLQVGMYLFWREGFPPKLQNLKSHLVTIFLIGKQETGNKKVKVIRTSTNSISQYSDKTHMRPNGKTLRISPRHS
jgi:hypothetical protein